MTIIVAADIPDWIQAYAAVAIAGLTAWTLKVLREYARDTKHIAQYGEQQIEHSQMPFLGVAERAGGMGRIGGYYIENQGFGPALNIKYTFSDRAHARFERKIPSLGAGGAQPDSVISTTFDSGDALEIEYSSLSGKRYRTVVSRSSGQVQTEFHEL